MPPSMTAMPSSEVAMGRWMKGDETLMAGRYSLRLRKALPLALAFAPFTRLDRAGDVGAFDDHVLAFTQPAKAAGDDDLAGVEPFLDRGFLVVLLLHLDLAYRHRVVAADHVHKGSGRATLNGCRWHHYDVVQGL